MRVFDHIGIPTTQPHDVEMYVEATNVWVTDPDAHPYRIEYVRYPETPAEGGKRRMPHIAYTVDSIEAEIAGKEIVRAPFNVNEKLRVAFYIEDGALIELMEKSGDAHWFRPTSKQSGTP